MFSEREYAEMVSRNKARRARQDVDGHWCCEKCFKRGDTESECMMMCSCWRGWNHVYVPPKNVS